LQLAAQLPDNTAEALTVLDHCRALVLGFLETEDTAGKVRSLSVMTGLREPI
jgi:hypothetical protein